MYKVMLADTDPENIRNIKNYMNSQFPEFSIAKAVTQFKDDAMIQIRKGGIQLIIADVRFFGANSYSVIQEINQRFPELRFILYGSLNDVEYLKRSMDAGTIDYMIKPLKPSGLGRCLKAAIKYFEFAAEREKEAARLQSKYKDSFGIFEMQFLQNLVRGVITSDAEIAASFRYFSIGLKERFVVLHIRINRFKQVIKGMDEEKKHLMTYGVLNTVILSLNDRKHKTFMDSFNAVTVILSEAGEIGETYKICDMIRNNIFNRNNIEVTIGVGRVYDKPSEIYISYNEAVNALKHKYYMGYSTIIPIEYVEPENHITFRYPIEKENKLVYAAVTGEFEYCQALLQDIFAALRASAPLPSMLLSQIVVDILISIGRYSKEQNFLKDNKVSEFFPIDEAMKLDGIDEGYMYLYTTLKEFCDYVKKKRIKADRDLVRKAKQYLETKYYEAISLNKTALSVMTTPEYLNHLFIEYERKTYFEYAVHLRLDIAKKFLRDTDLDDDMIAVNIGYDDGKYFNGVFKQYENMSTDEYRAQYRK